MGQGQHVGAALEDEALLLAVIALRLDRLGTGLEDEELDVAAVEVGEVRPSGEVGCNCGRW